MKPRHTRRLWQIRVPTALPTPVSGLKLAALVAQICAVVGACVRASRGLADPVLLHPIVGYLTQIWAILGRHLTVAGGK